MIGALAFFQRLMLGGPTKRISSALIRELSWRDIISFPYRLRERFRRAPDVDADVDPMARSAGYLTRLLINVITFLPTAGAMAFPMLVMCWSTERWPAGQTVLSQLLSWRTPLALVLFMIYVTCCALHEIVRSWRQVVRTLV